MEEIPSPLRGNLRNKIIGWTFIPSLILLAAVAWYVFYAYQQAAAELVIRQAQEVTSARALKLGMEQILPYIEEKTRILYYQQDFYTQDPAALQRALLRFEEELKFFDGGVLLVPQSGRVVAASPLLSDRIGQDWSLNPTFQAALRQPGSLTFSDVGPNGAQNSPVIGVALCWLNAATRQSTVLIGLLNAPPPPDSLFFSRLTGAEWDSYSYLLDARGQLIYSSNAHVQAGIVGERAIVKQALGGGSTPMRSTETDGSETISTYARLAQPLGWIYVREYPLNDLLGESLKYTRWLLGLLALGVLVPTVVVAVGVRRITRPIETLTAAARRISHGQFDAKIHIHTGDELEDLAGEFNAMADRLQESYSTLEERVTARTRELQALNSISSAVSHSLELDEVLDEALNRTLELTGLEAGAAYSLETIEGREVPVLVSLRGIDRPLARPLATLLFEQIAAGDRQVRVMSPDELPEGGLRERAAEEQVQRLVLAPLESRSRLLGWLLLGCRCEYDPPAEELALLRSIGQITGAAMENARSYRQAEELAVTVERTRLARDLHDAVTQTLFSASLIAEVVPVLWQTNPPEAERRTAELRQLTRGALAEMRTLLLELRPAALTAVGLPDLLRQLGEAATGRSRLPVTVVCEGQRRLPDDVQIAFYRVAQEALNNTIKYARAREARVDLRMQADRVSLLVSDDGAGFDREAVGADHMGLRIMRERAEAIGAHLTLDTAPGEGCHVGLVWMDSKREEVNG